MKRCYLPVFLVLASTVSMKVRPQLWISRVIISAQFLALLLGLFCGPARSEAYDYDRLVAMVHSSKPAVHMEGKEKIALIIKKTLLRSQFYYGPEQFTENCFCFGHFINPRAPDLAVGISLPPHRGNLVILTQKNGRYITEHAVTGIGFVEDMEVVRLFPGALDQLALNLYGGGSDWEHWGKDIYRWDGKAMRLIWAWIREDVFKRWPNPHGEGVGTRVRGEISLDGSNRDGVKEVVTSDTVEECVFSDDTEMAKVVSRRETKRIHRWDESLFYFVYEYGEIVAPSITAQCTEGIPQKETSKILTEGTRVGILEPPGYFKFETEVYHAVIGKECFCEIPKSAVRLLNEGSQ
jgi:hypothetical protein